MLWSNRFICWFLYHLNIQLTERYRIHSFILSELFLSALQGHVGPRDTWRSLEGILLLEGNWFNCFVQGIQSLRATIYNEKYLYFVAQYSYTYIYAYIHEYTSIYTHMTIIYIYTCIYGLKPKFQETILTCTVCQDIWVFSTLFDFFNFLKMLVRIIDFITY